MNITKIVLGFLDTNCYILKKGNNCLVVDPASEFNKIKNEIGNLNLVGILVTHHHFDHIGALEEVKKYYNVPVYDYNNSKNNCDYFDFDIINNPGHTSDSVSFYFEQENVMFVGDFIFKESIGRTDLDTGSDKDMFKSLNMIKKYDNNITLYPGHGDSTTLDYEKKNNMYLKNIL